MWAGAYFQWISQGPTARGRRTSALQFWGFLLFMHTPVDAELPNIDMATPVGKGLVFSVTPPLQRDRVPSLSNFGVYAYTICRRSTLFDNTCREGA